MSRFLFLAILLVVGLGLVLHFNAELPRWASWIGELPGDMVITKGDVLIYIPASSAVIISAVLSLVLSSLFENKK